ncbi:hypothetical protein V8G54_000955 [Vigna mungo]|uniref:Protein kinase domain-containing protein n=1 Tax=Vigna mungo TaxID=3915 RepID=A0AAQ3SB12_VIGMU
MLIQSWFLSVTSLHILLQKLFSGRSTIHQFAFPSHVICRTQCNFISKFTLAGAARSMPRGIRSGSGSQSFNSGTITYTGSAKIFTLNDLEKATNNFDSSRILGEGGFGLVYKGVLNDGRDIAVKVLKRDDQRGGREFLAEVEMLSRLHHRNLVTLFGICIEKHTRCLVYELVPNGSLESHLHGKQKCSFKKLSLLLEVKKYQFLESDY